MAVVYLFQPQLLLHLFLRPFFLGVAVPTLALAWMGYAVHSLDGVVVLISIVKVVAKTHMDTVLLISQTPQQL